MELLKNVVNELEKGIKENADTITTQKIHALTELLKVLTYSFTFEHGDIRFNYNLIEKKLEH